MTLSSMLCFVYRSRYGYYHLQVSKVEHPLLLIESVVASSIAPLQMLLATIRK